MPEACSLRSDHPLAALAVLKIRKFAEPCECKWRPTDWRDVETKLIRRDHLVTGVSH